MVTNKFYLTMVLLALTLSLGLAQSFTIHLNQSFYIVGQTLSFVVYPHKDLMVDSMLVYAELYSPGSELRQQRIYRLHDRSLEGIMDLPISYEEGNYVLTFYALSDTGKFSSQAIYTSINVPVFNDLEEKPEVAENVIVPPLGESNTHPDDIFDVRKNYMWTVDLRPLTDSPEEGEYSVSIFKYEGFDSNGTMETLSVPPWYKEKNLSTSVRKKLFLEGNLTDGQNKKNITEKYLSLYLPGSGYFQRIQATAGEVKAALPDIYDIHKAQLLSMNPNQRLHLNWKPVTSYFNIELIKDRAGKLKRDQAINGALWQNSKRRLIEDIFKISSPARPIQSDTVKSFVPDKSYILSDYKDLKTLRNFIKEVMIDCRITTEMNDRQSLRLRNKDLNQLYRWPAWYLVDGLFVGDDSLTLNLDLADIERIDLYNRNTTFHQQFDPMMAYTGVISIHTISREQRAVNIFPLNGLSIDQPVTSPLLPLDVPDLRTQLCWSTKLKSDRTGHLKVGFTSSDVKGIFAVDIYGVDGHQVPLNKRLFIEVR